RRAAASISAFQFIPPSCCRSYANAIGLDRPRKQGNTVKRDDRRSPFRDAGTDVQTAHGTPDTPQTRSPSYRLAFADDAFLCREELRPVRLQLELLKPQMFLDEYKIESTVVLFGGARIPAPV